MIAKKNLKYKSGEYILSGKSTSLMDANNRISFRFAISPGGERIALWRQISKSNNFEFSAIGERTALWRQTVESSDKRGDIYKLSVFDMQLGRITESSEDMTDAVDLVWTATGNLAAVPSRFTPQEIYERSFRIESRTVQPPIRFFDPVSMRVVGQTPARCRNIVVEDELLGFGGPDCAEPAKGNMWRNALDGRPWQPLAFSLPDDEVLVDLRLLRDGKTVLVTSAQAATNLAGSDVGRPGIHRVVDATTGQVIPRNSAMFDAENSILPEWLAKPPPSPPGLSAVLASGRLPKLSAGWSLTQDYILHFWRTRDLKPLLDLYLLNDNGYLVTSPYGTYDTNLGPDTPVFRWSMADDPRRSLAPQTFMRDYFEPKLMARRLACTVPDNCAAVFRPPPAIAGLNRTLPETRITSVVASKVPDIVDVTVTVRGGENREAVNGKTLSGVHDLRVFRNGQLVAQFPKQSLDGALPADLAGWASASRLVETGKGGLTITLPVRLKHGETSAEFTAYAFNNERVKGETFRYSYVGDGAAVTPQLPARQPRAIVLTFGVDTNGNADWERWRLGYAASDARSMAKALSLIPGYGVETLALTSTGVADNRATKAIMRAVLLALSGNAGVAEQAILRDAGIPAASLAPLRPDDMLIISWSGHGVTLDNQFYLVPADASAGDMGTPRPDSMISAADLSRWLGAMDATDMALIIDACHSAARVDDGRFKPGPMGDAGLGQLAFDKGIRILAASQADAVALEFGSIGHGLLSYALFHDGLAGPAADSDGDGKVPIGEWLSWGVARVPALAAELTGRAVAAPAVTGRGLIDEGAPPRPRVTVQQPALFDFNNSLGPTLLQR